MKDSDVHDKEALKDLLCDLFGFAMVTKIELIYERYRCLNYRISTPTQEYFLKQYRGRSSEEVFETKFAEQFFSENEIPILLPVKDRFQRPAFKYADEWFSLFDFVQAKQPDPHHLTDAFLVSLGGQLAKLHRVGSLVRLDSFRRLRLWDAEEFVFEVVELNTLLEQEQEKSGVPSLVFETMEKKMKFVTQCQKTAKDFTLPFDCLLHGDPIYQNTFVNDADQVIALFDLEDACVGPRAYEVSRAILINCFESGWGDQEFHRARTFFRAYQHVYPISFEEFQQGVEMYMIKNAHKLWFEVKHLFDGGEEIKRCYEAHANRVRHLTDNWELFCRNIYSAG